MDAGASGIIVPMVTTPDEALQAVQSVRYPPLGKRGVGLARARLMVWNLRLTRNG